MDEKKLQNAINPAFTKSAMADKEEKILKFWEENNIFEKSLKKDSPKGNYVFYDGPPFATGLPHYGHILGSTAKDVVGRYKTMGGYSVPRRWGWDCHGLPIENIVEKDLGISGRKAIEEFGVEKFSEYARSKVLTYVGEWKKTVDRIGRWVDFDNSYKTMDNTFIESVWWALGELNSKGLLYEGVRVLAYCPRCETPIANSEIAMDNSYKDITDISVYVKFRVKTEDASQESHPLFNASTLTRSGVFPATYLLAWTTTPWTLPGNTAIAINKDIDYVFVRQDEEIFILAKKLFEKNKEKFKDPKVETELKGSELVGLSYEPVFDYYKNSEQAKNENIWKVWHADFVTDDQGTGIAHEAPAFGEDDMNLAKMNNIPWIIHVDETGKFKNEVLDFKGKNVKPKSEDEKIRFESDIEIIRYLQNKNLFFAKEKIVHSYPHCYRCDTPLLYYALPSWFVNVQKVKSDVIKNSEFMNWIPSHLKDGRFKNILENAPDWTISRNRFWASPLPIWKNKDGKILFVNSLEDLKKKIKKSGNKYFIMRHGEAENNLNHLWDSSLQSTKKLTEKGIEQVKKTGEQLKSKNIDVIISSPILRTKSSAEIVASIISFSKEKIVLDERLREVDPGDKYQGKPLNDFLGIFKSYKDRYIKINTDGENYKDVKNRVMDAIYDYEKKYKNKNILIVSHGGPIMNMIIGSMGLLHSEIDENIENIHYPKNAELKELDFVPLPHNSNYELDFHRPYIDEITLVDDEGIEYKRIPEVIDCWFESGSMPFAQDHFPFEKQNWKKENFPGGFVAEYIAQTRTWFYYTHVISSILFNHAPFENVITTGTILAEDGSKMSKLKNNFPDPWIIFDKYGVDALRFYLMSSSLMKGEDINFSEKLVQEISSKIIGRLSNVVAFYNLYRDPEVEHRRTRDEHGSRQGAHYGAGSKHSTHTLDRWILARFDELIKEVTQNMDNYDVALATRPFDLFIDDLSTWYLRRSRDRLKDGDKEARMTLYYVLKNLAKLMAPFAPFTAEDIWQSLKTDKDEESVHLSKWPEISKNIFANIFGNKNEKVLREMEEVRSIVNQALKERQKAGVAVRQPLSELKVKGVEFKDAYIEILKDELNVKNVVFTNDGDEKVSLNFEITPELKKEGQYREIVRAVQDMRKKMGLVPEDRINITLSKNCEDLVLEFMSDFTKTIGAVDVIFADNDGEEIKIDEFNVKIKILK